MAEKEGLEVIYTAQALRLAQEITTYLSKQFSRREVTRFYQSLAQFERIIVLYPYLYPESAQLQARKAVLSKVLSVVYFVKGGRVVVLAILDNRWEERMKQ